MKTERNPLRVVASHPNSRWRSIVVIGVAALLVAGAVVSAADEPPIARDAQSTTGPRRPASQTLEAQLSVARLLAISNPVVISNVPAYLWYRGCGPTSVGMVLGYWDGRGYDDLVPGSAATQTTAVNNMMASSQHYSDYSLPLDYYPTLVADGSQTNVGGCHTDNSVADFMQTSRSLYGNYWGWGYFSRVYNGLVNYVNMVAPQYECGAQSLTFSSFTWNRYCSEIASNHPVVLLVDSDSDGFSDHFVAGIGYGTDGTTNMYACYDTWDKNVHWYAFTNMASGRPYGIYGATFFSLAPLVTEPPTKPTNPSPTNTATGVSCSAILAWHQGTNAASYDVYLGTNPTPGAPEFQTSQAGTNYTPGALANERTYYWRVDAVNAAGKATGDVWSFTTIPLVMHYVSPSGSNVAPYTSWANAATSIQQAIVVAVDGESILVSNGTYRLSSRIDLAKDIRIESANGPDATIVDGRNTYSCFLLSNGVIKGFTIANGQSAANGAGVSFGYGGRIENCVVASNTAVGNGGGLYFLGGGEARNCLIVSNSALYGGGAYINADGTLQNCTVVDNRATKGGGSIGGGGIWSGGNGTLCNVIIWSNYARNGADYDLAPATAVRCDTTPAFGGSVTVTAVPDAYNHFAGWSGEVPGADTNNNPLTLVLDRACEITAAFGENRTTNTDTPEWWLALYGLTNDPFEVEAVCDTDEDGLCAWEERVADTDPTNRFSTFEIEILLRGSEQFVTFSSSTGRVYTLQGTTAPLQPGSWVNLDIRIPGTNTLTTLSDPGGSAWGAYRIQVEFP